MTEGFHLGYNKDGVVIARMRAPRLSCQQFDVLIKFMRAHPHFAAGRAGGSPGLTTREEHEMRWQQLTAELNSSIGPNKSTHKWQKCWVDLKSNAKGRVAKIRAALSNPSLEAITPALTQWDHQVLSLLGPAYADILTLYKDKQKRHDAESGNETISMETNSNSSFHENDQNFMQHLENSPQRSPLVANGRNTNSSNVILREVKRELEEDQPEIIYEEEEDIQDVEYEAGETEFRDELETEQYIPLQNGVTAPLGTCISPSVTVSPVTVPVKRHSNIPLVSSSTTLRSRNIEICPEIPSSRKRKAVNERDGEERYEKMPKGTLEVLERLANAAEESNNIQRQVADALNRLSDSIAQVVPFLSQCAANTASSKKKN